MALKAEATPTAPTHARLRFGFCFTQTRNAVAVLPLTPFLEQFSAFEALEHISFPAKGGGCAKTTML